MHILANSNIVGIPLERNNKFETLKSLEDLELELAWEKSLINPHLSNPKKVEMRYCDSILLISRKEAWHVQDALASEGLAEIVSSFIVLVDKAN